MTSEILIKEWNSAIANRDWDSQDFIGSELYRRNPTPSAAREYKISVGFSGIPRLYPSDPHRDVTILNTLSTRTKSCLLNESIDSDDHALEAITNFPKKDWMRAPNIGMKTYNEIALAYLGGPNSSQLVTLKGIHAFFKSAEEEVSKAVKKFPQPNPSLAALTEETGELAQAILHIREGKSNNWQKVYCEAVQVAAVACRVALEGDSTVGATPTTENLGAK